MAKVVMSVRVDERTREVWTRLAKEEGRSFGNYLDQMFEREQARLALTGSDAMEVIADKLTKISLWLEGMMLKAVTKEKKEGGRKATAYDMDFENNPEVVSEETWKEWIDHLHRSDVHLNHYQATKQFDRLVEISEEDWDCELLIAELIKEGARKIYLPFSWKK